MAPKLFRVQTSPVICARMMEAGSVGVPHPLQFARRLVQGFVPGNALELPFAPAAHPLQGIQQAVRSIDPLAVGAASEAAAKLRLLAVIRLNPGDDAVLDVDPHEAGAAAVAGADGIDYLLAPGSQSLSVTHPCFF